jgi:hypothetical protein
MVSGEVYKAIRFFNHNHEHKFENVYIHEWEADCFSVTKSGYSYEIEVKVSRSDFFADFKKPKHQFFRTFKTGRGILNLGESWKCEGWPIVDTFPELREFRIRYTNFNASNFSYKNCPNKFFFACPSGLIDISEVPEYAGLIYVGKEYLDEYRVIKKAPYLHKDPVKPNELLFDKYYWMCMDQKNKIRDLQWRVDDFESQKERV